MHEPDRDGNWPALLRGSLLSATLNKQVQMLAMADRRAQAIITINAILLPLALSQSGKPGCTWAIIVFACGAGSSLLFAVMSLTPKRYQQCRREAGLLHFSMISRFNEEAYCEMMRKELETRDGLSALITRDIYHLSRDVLTPKYRLLRWSYWVFLCGGLTSLLLFLSGAQGF